MANEVVQSNRSIAQQQGNTVLLTPSVRNYLEKSPDWTPSEKMILEIREKALPLKNFNDKQKDIFYDSVMLRIGVIYGIGLPNVGTTAWKTIKSELGDLFYQHPRFNVLNPEEIITAMRMNVDGELDNRTEPYGVLSRKFVSSILQEYLHKRSSVILKLDNSIPIERPKPDPVDIAIEYAMFLRSEIFKRLKPPLK